MSYKDVLVHLDNTEVCAARVAAALALAKRDGARVTGIAMALESTIATYIGIDFPASLTEEQQALVENSANNAVARFKAAAKEAGVEYKVRTIKCPATKAAGRLAFFARHADMTFLGQADPDSAGRSFQESLLDSVLHHSGRPVYMVPYIGRFEHKTRHAVIAWDGSKKAVRAVSDAIPMLTARDEVDVLVVNPEQRSDEFGGQQGENLVEHLARYGINAKVVERTNPEVGVATVILNHIADVGADLLVMGAFGQSRLREKTFGGVTNTILHQMTAPVVMSE